MHRALRVVCSSALPPGRTHTHGHRGRCCCCCCFAVSAVAVDDHRLINHRRPLDAITGADNSCCLHLLWFGTGHTGSSCTKKKKRCLRHVVDKDVVCLSLLNVVVVVIMRLGFGVLVSLSDQQHSLVRGSSVVRTEWWLCCLHHLCA